MKRLTHLAEADLHYLLEASQQLRDALFTTASAPLREAMIRLLDDLNIHCDSHSEISEFCLLELITLLRDLFKSQFEKLKIVPIVELNGKQLAYLNTRIESHPADRGPPTVWKTPAAATHLFAVVNEANTVIGMVHLYAVPQNRIDLGWWIGETYREQRYAYPLLDACASVCKAREVFAVAGIVIEDPCYERSDKLVKYFRLHFQ